MQDFVGFGALSEAFHSLTQDGVRRLLVVASRSGWDRFNAVEKRAFFTERHTELFSGFSINPEIREIMAGVETFRACKPDCLVALGGGSAIDVAKMLKAVAFSHAPFDPAQPEKLTPSGDGPPLVAIATTAGSGAEATQYAVFYRGVEKQSVAHPALRPEAAVVDPELTYSLPPPQTAATGFDALCQAVEAFWCSNTGTEAQELARAAIRCILPNLYNAVHSPDPDNRYNMAQGAYLAGKAINFTRTTMPHALAYHLTKVYGLPHGHAAAITLPYFFLINSDPSRPVNTPLGRDGNLKNMHDLFVLLGLDTAEDCFHFWRNLLKACGLTPTLREAGVDTMEKMRALIGSMNTARQKNNPVHIEADALAAFLMDYA